MEFGFYKFCLTGLGLDFVFLFFISLQLSVVQLAMVASVTFSDSGSAPVPNF